MGRSFWACLAVILVLVGAGSVSASLFVDPSRIILYEEAGGRATGSILVTNRSNRDLAFQAVLYDWHLNELDEMVELPPGSLEESLNGLIRFNPRQFTLGPGESQTVRFTVELPPNQGLFERRGVIFFETETEVNTGETGATIKQMVGTTIYILPPQAPVVVNLLDALVHRDDEGNHWGALLVENQSRVHVRHQVFYTVLNAQNREVVQGEGLQRVILPGDRRGVFFQLPQLEPGEYSLIISMGFVGHEGRLQHRFSFSIKE